MVRSDINHAKTGQRWDYNDLAKSLGMLAILWGHIRLTGWSNAFVYAWHIPLFFFLSGMVFDKSRYANFRTFITTVQRNYPIGSVDLNRNHSSDVLV